MLTITSSDGCYKCFEPEAIKFAITVGVKFMSDFTPFLIIPRGINSAR